jgi:hypothetical protein
VAITCPVNFDVKSLRKEVQSIYSRVADAPHGEFHFHRGPAYAAQMLGYDGAELAALPADVASSFAGVANPHAIAPLPKGATVDQRFSGVGFHERGHHAPLRVLCRDNQGTDCPALWRGWSERVSRSRHLGRWE